MKKKLPTIRDVAAGAGVSTATISKFINGTQRFSSSVEAKITEVIRDLGYHSNPLAQSMITGRTKSIGLSILDVSNPHFTSIVKGANRIAIEHSYTLLLVDTEENLGREKLLIEALSRRVDGMIIFSRMTESELSWTGQLEKPLVFFGRLTQLAFPCVSSDDHKGAYMLAQHLITLGHKRIAYLGFGKSRRDEERLAGIQECLAEHQLTADVYNTNSPSAQEGERLCSTIMLGRQHPDAVVCYNDLMALGFMKEAQSLGFDIPKDVSVAGFDNIQYGRYISPALTTVDLQSEEMGVTAMRKLINMINGDTGNELTTVDAKLIMRSSVMSRK
ncbi:LacI family DNA-binding transcriptional regulator [Undibacterium sp. TJN19]|uniref:LacI family DNA-binding transcriptional regulator n=1 Tax=Undibacterium sp. TJN19 TaxID=3413055 RepID=UPI003BF3199C